MQKPITLIIDDEPVAREALEALLATEHYQVESATDGLQGLERAAQLLPDVILLDVMMPGIDGYEVCRRLRADPRLATVPVLMVTALDNQDARLRGLESGADDFISKPFDRAELRARLRTITRLNRYRNLSTERARFAWIVEQTQDGYLILGEDDKILYANRQARLYLGLSDLALSGITNKKALNFLDVARQQYQLQPGDAWSKWPAVRDPLRLYLVRPETSTAHSFWLMVNLLPSEVENNGRLLRLSNVTDRIFSQQDVRKFHHAIEQKFRTPISQIQISLDLLLRRTKKQHFDDLSDLATHAIEGMSKIKSQMDDIFRYLKAPALASRGETFSLAALPDMLNVLSSTFNISPIQICMPDDLQQTKLALTQPAIELIFWELLENSKKYHPTLTPKIEISISQISAQAIQLLIQDDGIHLSPQQIANVWEPYMQGEKGFSGEAPGMGLGLPLVSSLVWQVGGSAGISNRANRPGVVVELTIPLAGADS